MRPGQGARADQVSLPDANRVGNIAVARWNVCRSAQTWHCDPAWPSVISTSLTA